MFHMMSSFFYNFIYPTPFYVCQAGGENAEDETLDLSVKSAIMFVISASGFLVLLFFFMSSWFVLLLIVLFCIGGVEVHLHLYLCKNL